MPSSSEDDRAELRSYQIGASSRAFRKEYRSQDRVFMSAERLSRPRNNGASATTGKVDCDETVAMLNDKQPIVDYFRRTFDCEVVGMMCVEGDARRYFFACMKSGSQMLDQDRTLRSFKPSQRVIRYPSVPASKSE
jgi:hypothetical protein